MAKLLDDLLEGECGLIVQRAQQAEFFPGCPR